MGAIAHASATAIAGGGNGAILSGESSNNNAVFAGTLLQIVFLVSTLYYVFMLIHIKCTLSPHLQLKIISKICMLEVSNYTYI